ncbi:Eco57I restriction-modification methylase domain-containing protein [Methylocaldum sp. GT1BB]|jgi:hypothetical protein|uniref:Eco57I restriction-modification methylase domain-containing protein n=1 Tax=Methylocaldum sp. GT1BB TaxID=3438963 RepID=UPI003DA02278
MSIARHHADWLSLVEVSGPFVSLPVLMRVFPQGLEPRDPAQAKALRAAYDAWRDHPGAPGGQRGWVWHVLTAVLGYPSDLIAEGQTLPAGLEAAMPMMGETLRPDFALVGPASSETAGQTHLLIVSYPAEQALDKPVTGKHWKATPATRMMELLHGAGVPLGLVTNGEHWMLVYAPRGETTGYASWYASLWLDEAITLRAFHSLLGVRRFFGVAADSTLLALLKESAQDQQEVTDQLGYQVREAVEVLVQSLDALDRESHRSLLKGVAETELYNAALTVMMRLVFLFSAEERGLLHLGKPLYDDHYAVSTLQEQLQEVADRHGEEVLERRYDAWARLLATFRAVHGGIRHQDLLMPAYGGSLFDPDRYPFLEGRAAGTAWCHAPAEPLAVNNRVVLHLLNSLQRLRTKIPGGGPAETRRVSFRALGVEQIGHVYEGLLDHTAVRAAELVLGIKGTRSKEPEIPLAVLESWLAKGKDPLVDFLKEATGRSVSVLRKALDEGNLLDEHKLSVACGHNEALLARVRPFVGLIREDSFERPLVVLAGSLYVTEGTTRRSTGTHYTPPSLTEPIVRHTLEPLVYDGPAEGWPQEQWKLKSPKAILDLKVCDMAMGSGAFLVQACRYLAEKLVEAWENEEKQHPGEVLVTPDGQFSTGQPTERLVPAEAAERIAIARRVVADRCLYGVDINPMAVEMAKLSLWLVTVDKNRPFTFLDHAFKCGDSLLGITSLKQLENFSLRPGGGKQLAFSTLNLWRHIEEAKKKREMLEAMPSDTPEQIAGKAALYAEAEEAVAKLSAAADVLVSVELQGLKGKAYEAERETAADHMMVYWAEGLPELQAYARRRLGKRRCFHWALAFPEITEAGGFHAFVGNPPFMGGSQIREAFGEGYLAQLKSSWPNNGTTTNFVAYFFRRAFDLINKHGSFGLISTTTISEGDTREASLDVIMTQGGTIFFALPHLKWPGAASVMVSIVGVSKLKTNQVPLLNGREVPHISSYLDEGNQNIKPALQLIENSGIAFNGSKLYGQGFILSPIEAHKLIDDNLSNKNVIYSYLTSKDLTDFPDCQPTAFVINFGDMSEHEASQYRECFSIITSRVLPERKSNRRDQYRRYWWRYAERRAGLNNALQTVTYVLVAPAVAKYTIFSRISASKIVIDHNLIALILPEWWGFSVIQSAIHLAWSLRLSSTVEIRSGYRPSDCFDTFPFPRFSVPESRSMLDVIGERYYQHRQFIAQTHQEGLTKTYNRFHNPAETSADIAELRRLHVEMDQAVAAAYGWQDLDLGHGFHETKQGLRYTISEPARREVLNRLLELNHQRYAEEVAAGLHDKAAKKSGRVGRGGKKKDDNGQMTMDL